MIIESAAFRMRLDRFSNNLFSQRIVHIHRGNRSAFGNIGSDHRRADPLSTSGYDDAFTFQLLHAASRYLSCW